MTTTLTDQSTVVVVPNQVSSNLAGEEVILHIESGIYFGLDTVGARIWELVHQPCTIAEINQTISDEYNVELERCAADIRQFLTSLAEAHLIEISTT